VIAIVFGLTLLRINAQTTQPIALRDMGSFHMVAGSSTSPASQLVKMALFRVPKSSSEFADLSPESYRRPSRRARID
jgi:hypothetical protein